MLAGWASQPDPNPKIAGAQQGRFLATVLPKSALARGLAQTRYTTTGRGTISSQHRATGRDPRCMPARDTRGNVFAFLPKAIDRELVEALLDDPAVCIQRIVSTGQVTSEDELCCR